jgi:acetoacetyl-CoA synthetase
MIDSLWQPDAQTIASANVTRFMREVSKTHGVTLDSYQDLHQWSVDKPQLFWGELWSFTGIVASEISDVIADRLDQMPGARWFPNARLNFAENLLRHRGSGTAIVFRNENSDTRSYTYDALHDEVSRFAQALRAMGVTVGDRVAAYVPNSPEAVIAMLAATSIGFGQIEPKVLISAEGYYYNGKRHDCLKKLSEIKTKLPTVERVVVFANTSNTQDISDVESSVWWQDFVAGFTAQRIDFEQLAFVHPVYIMYSSGTTGAPKCIIHGAGGTLIQHLKEHLLHTDIHPGDRLFYFTTCGWMMWNWLVSGLASGATLLLYDGSPFYPDGNALFDYAQDHGMTVFGTSAKYIDAVKKAGLAPIESHDLAGLKTMTSTGSPLAPESFDFVYEKIKQNLCLSSISGGTDIMGCFALGNPTLPVWRGELQCIGLGMRVVVLDENGQELPPGHKGELACTAPFPSMPVGFWNDPKDEKYHAAYFEKFPGVWCHGDYIELTEHNGVIIYGRSDAVLNPGGVRIGTAEIYRQAEQVDEVVEGLVIGQQWQDDVRVILFVRLRDGLELDDALIDKIKQQIRNNATRRHVPAKVIQVADIPRTKSGKIVELAVRNVVHGEPVKNKEALANPEALDLYADLPELQS